MIKQELKEQLAKATLQFWNKDLSPGMDSGDLSIRDTETGLIYISPMPDDNLKIPNWSVTKPEHIVVMDIDGNLIEKNSILPTVENPMHLSIYRARPEVNAIVHSHAVWSQAFAIAGKNIPLVLGEQSYVLGGEVVCAEYGPAGSEKLGRNIVTALGEHKKAAIMRNHGAVALGKDLDEAFLMSDFLERGAKVYIMGNMLGSPIVLDPKDVFDDSILHLFGH